jgi:hypothetical protein
MSWLSLHSPSKRSFSLGTAPVSAEPEINLMCQALGAVVSDTFVAAHLYSRAAPDLDARALTIVALKVHEHRPMSDENMVKELGIDVEALEFVQEEILRRSGGCLLVQALNWMPPPTIASAVQGL